MEKASIPSARAGVTQIAVINTAREEKGTSMAEKEPHQMLMITPLAICDNEDENEGAPGGLCHPLGTSLDKTVARTVISFLHFGCLISFDLQYLLR